MRLGHSGWGCWRANRTGRQHSLDGEMVCNMIVCSVTGNQVNFIHQSNSRVRGNHSRPPRGCTFFRYRGRSRLLTPLFIPAWRFRPVFHMAMPETPREEAPSQPHREN
jgi:hypothetical protein